MSDFKELFEKVYGREDLTIPESRSALFAMMEAEWSPAQISAFLTSLHMKGETADELAGFALAMSEKAVPVVVSRGPVMDTCGTGGDRKGSFNISTITAFVLAGCGIPIAKHGNRAASSRCGSADLLEAMGMRYRLNAEEAAEALDRTGFAFLFAPDYHPATKSVVEIRKQLKVPTIFNLLGPLTNPAHPAVQLIGVYESDAVPLMADAIRKIDGSRRVVLLHSQDGWDEATQCGPFRHHPTFAEASIMDPASFGFAPCTPEELQGGSPQENAEIAMSILNGERGATRETVLLNALLGYLAFYPGSSPQTAKQAVEESLDSGAAMRVVEKYKQLFVGAHGMRPFSIIHELLRRKKADVEHRKCQITVPSDDRQVHWNRDRFHLIAEIKRSSLSAGVICNEIDIPVVAFAYEKAGVSAISVLTEEHYFDGSINDLRAAGAAVSIPLLQKDFVLDPFQILEAKVAGASFVLLIVRFLTTEQLRGMLRLCKEIRINAIVEVTDEQDLQKIMQPVTFLGVNSRDLETLQIDKGKFARLRPLLPDAFLIAESGISNAKDLADVMDLGYHGALIGEHLLRAQDPGAEALQLVRAIRKIPKVKICGITSERDAQLAIQCGADALGFIFAESPRRIQEEALALFRNKIPKEIMCVGVFRGQSENEALGIMKEFSLDVAQIYDPIDLPVPVWHAKTTSERCGENRDHVLWDVKAEDQLLPSIWRQLSETRVFALAGGLNPSNVSQAIAICEPEWIDVARGVESEPGVKDETKLSEFMKAVKG